MTAPLCPQCGEPYSAPACGPTHAHIYAGRTLTPRVWLRDAKACANSMAECISEGRIEAAIHRAQQFLESRETRLAKIAAIVEGAQDRNPAYLDAAEMLGVYLLACGSPVGEPER